MRDRQQPSIKLGDELQLNIIEMRKADRLKICLLYTSPSPRD